MLNRSTLSICRFKVTGQKPNVHDPEFCAEIEKFSVHKAVDSAEELGKAGWCGPLHFFDEDFSLANIFHEPYLTLGLRIDRKKIPGPLFKALCQKEEAEYRQSADVARVSPAKRREIREAIKLRLMEETRPSHTMVDWFWNINTSLLGVASFSKNALEVFQDLFERTFERELEPINPYTLGCTLLPAEVLDRFVAAEATDFLLGV